MSALLIETARLFLKPGHQPRPGWWLVAYKASVEAEDWEAPGYQSRVDAGNECKKFETKRRRLDLSFNHHHEVAALPPPKPTRFSIGARNRSRRMTRQVWGAAGSGRT
jgi:hypothetical protein